MKITYKNLFFILYISICIIITPFYANATQKGTKQGEEKLAEEIANFANQIQNKYANSTDQAVQYATSKLNSYINTTANEKIDSLFSTFGKAKSEIVFADLGKKGNILGIKSGKFDFLFPLYTSKNESFQDILFLQSGFVLNDKSSYEGRTFLHEGLGYRIKYDNNFYGLNTFVDYGLERKNVRGSIGWEMGMPIIALSGNFYFPLSAWRSSPDKFESIKDRAGKKVDLIERPAYGMDMSLMYLFPYVPEIMLTTTYKQFFGKHVGLSTNGKEIANPSSVEQSIEYSPIDLLSSKLTYSDKKGEPNDLSLSFQITYQFGKSLSEQLKKSRTSSILEKKFLDFVSRENNILLEYKQKNPPLLLQLATNIIKNNAIANLMDENIINLTAINKNSGQPATNKAIHWTATKQNKSGVLYTDGLGNTSLHLVSMVTGISPVIFTSPYMNHSKIVNINFISPSNKLDSGKDISKYLTDEDFTQTAKGGNGGKITYSSSDISVATIDKITGTVHIVGTGSTKIIATEEKTAYYPEQKDFYTLTVYKSKSNPLKWDYPNHTLTKMTPNPSGDTDIPIPPTFFLKPLTGGNGGKITFTSSNPSVADIDSESGEVTLYFKEGKTIIHAIQAETDKYKKNEAFLILKSEKPKNGYLHFYDSDSYVVKQYFDDSFTISPHGGNPDNYIYSSSDPTKASVDKKTGEVTIQGITGLKGIFITVTDNEPDFTQKASYVLKIEKADGNKGNALAFKTKDDPYTLDYKYGKSFTLPTNGGNNGTIVLHAMPTGIVEIDKQTNELTIKNSGRVSITAVEKETEYYKSQYAILNVFIKPTSLHFKEKNPVITYGDDKNKEIKYVPVGGSGKEINYSVIKGKDVVDVNSETGQITTKKAGNATISATQDGVDIQILSDTYDLTVKKAQGQPPFVANVPIPGIEYGISSRKIFVKPSNEGKITYTTSDKNIVSVDDDGNMSFNGVGTTHIIVIETSDKYTQTEYSFDQKVEGYKTGSLIMTTKDNNIENVKFNHKDALSYCNNLTFGNRSNWKLPSGSMLKKLFMDENVKNRLKNEFGNSDFVVWTEDIGSSGYNFKTIEFPTGDLLEENERSIRLVFCTTNQN